MGVRTHMDHPRFYLMLAFVAIPVMACAPDHRPAEPPAQKAYVAPEISPALQCYLDRVEQEPCVSRPWPEAVPEDIRHEVSALDCPPGHLPIADCYDLDGAWEIEAYRRAERR